MMIRFKDIKLRYKILMLLPGIFAVLYFGIWSVPITKEEALHRGNEYIRNLFEDVCKKKLELDVFRYSTSKGKVSEEPIYQIFYQLTYNEKHMEEIYLHITSDVSLLGFRFPVVESLASLLKYKKASERGECLWEQL